MDGIDGGGGACTRVGHRAPLPVTPARGPLPPPPPRLPLRATDRPRLPVLRHLTPLTTALPHAPRHRALPVPPHPDTPGSQWRAEEGGAGRNSSQRAGARLRRCGRARVGCPAEPGLSAASPAGPAGSRRSRSGRRSWWCPR